MARHVKNSILPPSTTNYGVAAVAGADVHLDDNLLVNDTLGPDGGTHDFSSFGQAISAHDTSGSTASGNRQNWRRDTWASSVPASEQPIGPGS